MAQLVKKPSATWETWVRSLGWEDSPGERSGYPLQYCYRASQVVLVVKNLPVNARDTRDAGLSPGLGRSPGGGHSNPLQYSCLENPMDRAAWWAKIHSVAKSDITEAT